MRHPHVPPPGNARSDCRARRTVWDKLQIPHAALIEGKQPAAVHPHACALRLTKALVNRLWAMHTSWRGFPDAPSPSPGVLRFAISSRQGAVEAGQQASSTSREPLPAEISIDCLEHCGEARLRRRIHIGCRSTSEHRRAALSRYLDDGSLPIDYNRAGNQIRP